MFPVMFNLSTPWGPLPVYSYGVFLGLGLLASWYWTLIQGKRLERINPDFLGSVFMYCVLGALVGARLLYVVTNSDQFSTLGEVVNLRTGGMVAYGGFLGAYFVALLVFRLRRTPMLPIVDIAAPSIGLGFLISRMGCYFYGCDYGHVLPDSAPNWLKRLGTFPEWNHATHFEGLKPGQDIPGSPAFLHHVSEYGTQMIGRTASLPVHPTQLYESLFGLALFFVGWRTLKHKRFDGHVLLVVTITYAAWRFLIEFVRGDLRRGSVLGLSTSQWISIALIAACFIAWHRLTKRKTEGREPPIPEHVRLPEQPKPTEN